MRRPRLGLTDAAILIAIVGLICAVPLHFRRFVDRDFSRAVGDAYLASGQELAAMAEHPEPWMDPFREDFRRFSTWQVEKGRRLFGSSRYDEEAERKRIVEAGIDRYEITFRNLYKRFEAVAARHGYRRPQIPRRHHALYEFGAFFTGWPLYGGVILLGGLLLWRWARGMRRSQPGTDPENERWLRLTKAKTCFACGGLVLLYSLAWAAIDVVIFAQADSNPWPHLLARAFEPSDGHGILSVLAVAIFIWGLALIASAIRDEWRRRRIDASMPDPGERPGPAEFPRADGPGASA